MLGILNAACTPQWPNVRYTQRHACMHACMHEVFQFSWCLLEQATQTNPMWAPQQGLVFIRSNDVIYGGPGFNVIYVHT